MLLMTLIYTFILQNKRESLQYRIMCISSYRCLILRFWSTRLNKKGFFWIVGVSVFDFAM